MDSKKVSLRDLHDSYLEWAGKPVMVFEYRKNELDAYPLKQIDILCYQSTEEDELEDEEHVSFLTTAGLSNHKMEGTIEYAELFLKIKGKKYVPFLEELSRELAEFVAIPFRHNISFSPNIIIDDFSFSLFTGMDSVLLSNWGITCSTYLPCVNKRILMIELHPIFKSEANIIEKIGDIEANRRFRMENIDWSIPERKPAVLD